MASYQQKSGYSTVAVLFTLMAVAVAGTRERQSRTAGGDNGKIPYSCVPLRNSCARSLFVGRLLPRVGYLGSSDWQQTVRDKEFEFLSLGLDRMVCDERCFSNLPNLLTFLTFVYFPPCIIEYGNTMILPPCQSLCEAARVEYSHYDNSCGNLSQACPASKNNIIDCAHLPIRCENVLDLEVFDCSQYATDSVCVPKRVPSMSCGRLPCTHVARLVHPTQLQTNYPHENAALQVTPLLSCTHRLIAVIGDSECRKNLPKTVSFLASACFPVCTAHKDSNSTLAYPSRNHCEAARRELGRYNNRKDELCLDCPAECNVSTALALPVFACWKYSQDSCAEPPCVDTPDPTVKPQCPINESICPHQRCRASFRNKVTRNSFSEKEFACVVQFHNFSHGPCFWNLELEVAHCYFDFANVTRPSDNVVVVPLSKLTRGCDYCSKMPEYFSVPGASEYLVAGQKLALHGGELVWSLDHTSKNSLIAPTTEIGSTQLKRALDKVATERDLIICHTSESLPYLCSPS